MLVRSCFKLTSLFEDMDRGVEGARRDDLAVLGMRPSDLPDRATVRLNIVATTE